ncbi:hypothetical protein [Geminocystis sp. NIES-3709]|uniref:hypothetical protein n=1 Tax=Geminocystis sp. NIES-3709 TaxID=1617448 RepID=UPI0005FCB764|nr:mobile element protein [Geminocystis sp. NIES-3709]
MKIKRVEKLLPKNFKRRFGVTKKTYQLLVKIVKNKKLGRKLKLTVEEQVMVTLQYFRE